MIRKPANRIELTDGPLHLQGQIRILTTEGKELFRGEETWLCRCGQSNNKPFCDSSHRKCGFDHPGTLDRMPRSDEAGERTGELTVTVRPGGPLMLDGPYILAGADGSEAAPAIKGALCRCGASDAKPICDGNHKALVDFDR